MRALRRRVFGKPPRARRYLRDSVSVDQFLGNLTAQDVRYVVLRWFDTLPSVAPEEDIDLLVADEDLKVVERLLSSRRSSPLAQKVDLYSESGIRGTAYCGVPYYSKKLAARVLKGAVLMKGKYKVPSARDHFDSLAFHAVYHKGQASGLPLKGKDGPSVTSVEHDYRAALESLLPHVQGPVEISLEGLDQYLCRSELRPAGDTLDRFQAKNPWLRTHLESARHDIGCLEGLIVFVVREAAMDFRDEIVRTIERYGLELLKIIDLNEEQRTGVAEMVRGGNWGQGPFSKSGGGPARLIVSYDHRNRTQVAPDGQVINKSGLEAKYAVRNLINSRFPESKRFNPMHSSDNGWHSLECLQALHQPSLVDELMLRIAEIETELELPWPVERLLQNGRRARVAIVDHPAHGKAVAKIFRTSARRFFERELAARKQFSDLAIVPRLLEHGDNWILSRLYEDTRKHVRRKLRATSQLQLTLPAMRAVASFVQELRNRGHFLLDLTSHNLISDARDGLVITDFEFLQSYSLPLPSLNHDYTVVGVPADPDVDRPVSSMEDRWDSRMTKTVFHPAVAGLSIGEFLRPERANYLRLKMSLIQAYWWAVSCCAYAWRKLRVSRRPRVS